MWRGCQPTELKLEVGFAGEMLDRWRLPFHFKDFGNHKLICIKSCEGVASQKRLGTSSMQYFAECFGLMYWLCEVWSLHGCSSASLCQAEVQVFGLALLSVWSSCFRKTDWPELRPNDPLYSQLKHFSFVLVSLHGYCYIVQNLAQLNLFLCIFNAEYQTTSSSLYVSAFTLLCSHSALWKNERFICPPSPLPVCCLSSAQVQSLLWNILTRVSEWLRTSGVHRGYQHSQHHHK